MQAFWKPKLRAKTGCFTCRQARKKCDEAGPVCGRCRDINRICKWPRAVDMIDRRSLSHREARKRAPGCQKRSARTCCPKDTDVVSDTCQATTTLKPHDLVSHESAMVHQATARGIETIVSRHFKYGFYELILLPKCHRGFFSGWLTDLSQLMASCAALQYSVLACAASHLYMMDGSALMQQLTLTYYSSAITKLLRLLADAQHPERDDGLLSTLIFLNIHGVQGYGTYADIDGHLKAASRILESRILRPTGTTERLFHIVSTESVLYHTFHATVGLWTDSSDADCPFDLYFWKQAESYLSGLDTFPDATDSFASPVLGVPPSLSRLALQLRQLYRNTLKINNTDLQELREEVAHWERALLLQSEFCTGLEGCPRPEIVREEFHRDATALYTLVVSFLFTKLFESRDDLCIDTTSNRWQLKKAIEVVQRNKSNDGWMRCYVGNWPIYTLGFFMPDPEERTVMTDDLQRRWHLTKMTQSRRFLEDIESAWLDGSQSS